MKISFIGFGNMAKAMAQNLAATGFYEISAASPSQKKEQGTDGINVYSDNLEVLPEANILILAVKPAKMAGILQQISPALPPKCLVISVAAGLPLDWLEQYCPRRQAIVRAMPNIAVAVGKGATPLFANPFVSAEQKGWSEQLFQCLGLFAWIKEESQMDSFTALSGSGPAYIFLFLEAMIEAAKRLGLDEKLAKRFALQTVNGALHLATSSELELSELRQKVTSPAGTTAAALEILQQQGINELVFKAMEAASQRAKEMAALAYQK